MRRCTSGTWWLERKAAWESNGREKKGFSKREFERGGTNRYQRERQE